MAKNPYPFRVMITVVDSKGKSHGAEQYACFNTLEQAKAAQQAAIESAFELEPNDIEGS